MKLSQFQDYLQRNKISFAFFLSPDSVITYFTQAKPWLAHLLITPRKAELSVTKLEFQPELKDIAVRLIPKNWQKKLPPAKKIGVNKKQITLSVFEDLQKRYPRAEFVDLSSDLDELRSLKTSKEIQKIKRACQITTNAYLSLLKEFSFNKFKTEQDIAFYLEEKICQQGAELAFPTIVASGKNAAIPHHKTSLAKLGRGFLLLDFGAQYQNYCADMTRMVYLGTPSQEEKENYALLLSVQEEALRKIKANLKYQQLDLAVKKKLGNKAKYFLHSLGHGLGLEIHEPPIFSAARIKQNQVFTIEPGLYFFQKYGLRIEDTVHFAGKARLLTKAPKKLVTFQP